MGKKQLVLVGNGMAGVRAIEEILSVAKDEFQITIFGAEPHPNYNRILLSKVLQGDTDIKDITLNDWDWYEENNIQLYTNETVIKVDTENKTVITDADRIQPYDELILATGSVPLSFRFRAQTKRRHSFPGHKRYRHNARRVKTI